MGDKYTRGERKKTALLFLFFFSFPKFFQSFGSMYSCWCTFPVPSCISATSPEGSAGRTWRKEEVMPSGHNLAKAAAVLGTNSDELVPAFCQSISSATRHCADQSWHLSEVLLPYFSCTRAPPHPKCAGARGTLCRLLLYGWLQMEAAQGRQKGERRRGRICCLPPAFGPVSAVSVRPSLSATCTQPCIAAQRTPLVGSLPSSAWGCASLPSPGEKGRGLGPRRAPHPTPLLIPVQL